MNPNAATLAPVCPWCALPLDEGEVLAVWISGLLTSLSQTRRLGASLYTWTHSAAGCHVPALARLPDPAASRLSRPPKMPQDAFSGPRPLSYPKPSPKPLAEATPRAPRPTIER
jgi:hypothetical protein